MKWAKSVKHLGNIVSSNLSEANEIEYKRGDLFGRVNSLLGNFSGTSRRVRARIFNAQCCHLYGSQCWRLDDRSIERMSTAINRSIRRVLNLPPRAHRYLLPILADRKPFIESVCNRAQKIRNQMSELNDDVGLLCKMCLDDSVSIISSNDVVIRRQMSNAKDVTPEEHSIAQAIIDLDNGVDAFSHAECEALICFLCLC